MALTTQSASIGGATKTLIVAADGSSNIAAAHVTVDSSGAEKGVNGNPLAVSGTFWQATQPVSLASLPALAAGSNTIGTVVPSQTSWTAIPTGTFARPANTTAYASGQLVANSTTAGSVTSLSLTVSRATGGTGQVARARLSKSSTSVTNASFRVHLYSASPTPANGDGAAWSTSGAASYLGSMDVTMSKAFTDGASGIGTPNEGAEIQFVCAGGSQLVYALIEARAAYTPTSAETFTLALEVMQD